MYYLVIKHNQRQIMQQLNEFSAFLYGESVFTTCLVINNKIRDLEQHLEQLVSNACDYYFLESEDKCRLQKLVEQQLDKTTLKDGALRITISSQNNIGIAKSVRFDDLIVTTSLRSVSAIEKPLKLVTHKRVQSALLDKFKIGSYGKEFYLKRYFKQQGFDDVLFVGEGIVFEATTSNIFFIKNKKLFTPIDGIYEGITRKKIIGANKVEQRQIQVEEIKSFESAFLTNSIHGLIPIESIDEKKLTLQDLSFIHY